MSDPLQPGELIPAHGGSLIDLVVDSGRAADIRASSPAWPSWDFTPRQLCDFELLANGGFSPLTGFMRREDYDSVCRDMRLADGTLWPIPIALDVTEAFASKVARGQPLALRDPEGVMLAALHVDDVWTPDRDAEARLVYGTTDAEHPGVAALARGNPVYIGGRIDAIQLPLHYDYRPLRQAPRAIRADCAARGWTRVIGYHTDGPIHRAQQALTLRAANRARAHLLLHPSVGLTTPADAGHYRRVRCYQAMLATYPPGTAKLALLPLANRHAGAREAAWRAIVHKNHGCTHVTADHDQEFLRAHERELGIEMVPARRMLYVPSLGRYVPENEVAPNADVMDISETQLQTLLAEGRPIPEWFTPPAVAEELRRTHRPRRNQGLTVLFTGLSGSGKSTIANALLVRLLEAGGRTVTLLDGDIVRKNLSNELGFSKEHRDINVRRIGFVASEITKAGGIALCAPIAPYDAIRKEVRAMIEPVGGFVLVHVATSIDVCEQRDRKGLYAKARAGLVPHFTGISDSYQPPDDADIVIDTLQTTVEEEADRIVEFLRTQEYL